MVTYDRVLKLSLERGFYFPSSDIYSDSPAGFWEYGPNGNNMKNKFIELWRRELVRRDEMVEIDGSQIMSKNVFIASGHIENFSDPIIMCNKCKATLRADKYIFEKLGINVPERLSNDEIDLIVNQYNLKCPKCGSDFHKTERFNMMFKVGIGPNNDEAYLRPETCQAIFVDFVRIYKTMRGKLPFPIAQVGKSFRNEISPRQSLLRLREFYQAEIEVFCNPTQLHNIPKFEDIKKTTLTIDDGLNVHKITAQEALERKIIKEKMEIMDPITNEKLLPHVFELSLGIDRSIYSILENSFCEDKDNNRNFLKLKPYLAPILVGILPLVKKPEIEEIAKQIYVNLKKDFDTYYDESGSIGRRYRRLEEIGVPFAITIDYDSLIDNTVTIRYRDTMEQKRIKIKDIKGFLYENTII